MRYPNRYSDSPGECHHHHHLQPIVTCDTGQGNDRGRLPAYGPNRLFSEGRVRIRKPGPCVFCPSRSRTGKREMSVVRLARIAREGLERTQDKLQEHVRQLPEQFEHIQETLVDKISKIPLVGAAITGRVTTDIEEPEEHKSSATSEIASSLEEISIPQDISSQLDWEKAYIQVPIKRGSNLTQQEVERSFRGDASDEEGSISSDAYPLSTTPVSHYSAKHETQSRGRKASKDKPDQTKRSRPKAPKTEKKYTSKNETQDTATTPSGQRSRRESSAASTARRHRSPSNSPQARPSPASTASPQNNPTIMTRVSPLKDANTPQRVYFPARQLRNDPASAGQAPSNGDQQQPPSQRQAPPSNPAATSQGRTPQDLGAYKAAPSQSTSHAYAIPSTNHEQKPSALSNLPSHAPRCYGARTGSCHDKCKLQSGGDGSNGVPSSTFGNPVQPQAVNYSQLGARGRVYTPIGSGGTAVIPNNRALGGDERHRMVDSHSNGRPRNWSVHTATRTSTYDEESSALARLKSETLKRLEEITSREKELRSFQRQMDARELVERGIPPIIGAVGGINFDSGHGQSRFSKPKTEPFPPRPDYGYSSGHSQSIGSHLKSAVNQYQREGSGLSSVPHDDSYGSLLPLERQQCEYPSNQAGVPVFVLDSCGFRNRKVFRTNKRLCTNELAPVAWETYKLDGSSSPVMQVPQIVPVKCVHDTLFN